MSSEIELLQQLEGVDLSTVETSFPLLDSGVVLARITAAKPDSQNDKAFLKVEYVTEEPWRTVAHDGVASKPINPGFPLSERIYFNSWTDPKTGETRNFGVQRYALLRECAVGVKAPAGTKINPSELVGLQVRLKLRFDPAPKNKTTGEVYGPQTTVDGYVRKPRAS